MSTFEQIDPNTLREDKKKKAIASLTILTEKRDGSIKVSACTDGRKQWEYTEKVATASPTALLESIFITVAIDAKEEWDVGIMDLPGAFLHAKNDERVVMFMKGKMAELMVHVA